MAKSNARAAAAAPVDAPIWEPAGLPVAIYLNQRLVFDLLATFEDGLMQARTETVQTSGENGRTTSGEASAGSGGLTAKFFSVALKGSRTVGDKQTSQEQQAGQRTHTTGSLFANLRTWLLDTGLLQTVEDGETFAAVQPGQFVEFRAVLTRNPWVDLMEAARDAFQLNAAGQEAAPQPTPAPQPAANGQRGLGGGKRKNQRDPVAEAKQAIEVITTLAQFANAAEAENAKAMERRVTAFLRDLTAANTIDLIGDVLGVEDAQAVITAETAMFAGASPKDVIDGEFRVLAKVTRVLTTEDEGSIRLLRKSTLALLGDSTIEQLREQLRQAGGADLNIAELHSEIRGPAVQAIPLAIFA